MPAKIPRAKPARPCPPARLAPIRDDQADADRREAKAFYKSRPWRTLRAEVLAKSPLCGDCLAVGELVAAVHVHHVEERRDRPDLALDERNLEGLCQSCHNRRHVRNGNPRR